MESIILEINNIVEEMEANTLDKNHPELVEYIRKIYDNYITQTKKIKEVVITEEQCLMDQLDLSYTNHGVDNKYKLDNSEGIQEAFNFIFNHDMDITDINPSFIEGIYISMMNGEEDFMSKLIDVTDEYATFIEDTPLTDPGIETYRLVKELTTNYTQETIIVEAVNIHNNYLKAFPAHKVGNGHTSRALMNHVLITGGFLPYVITEENIIAYEETVSEDLIFGTNRFMEHVIEDQLEQLNNLQVFMNELGAKQPIVIK